MEGTIGLKVAVTRGNGLKVLMAFVWTVIVAVVGWGKRGWGGSPQEERREKYYYGLTEAPKETIWNRMLQLQGACSGGGLRAADRGTAKWQDYDTGEDGFS